MAFCSIADVFPYFNPRSLTGATIAHACTDGSIFISIHAPSRERPLQCPPYHHLVFISIHAPSRERPPASIDFLFLSKFQSTLPHGSDLCLGLYLRSKKNISIHAPSRERPYLGITWGAVKWHFNPRSLTGATSGFFYRPYKGKRFQSTLPHGSDQSLFFRAFN